MAEFITFPDVLAVLVGPLRTALAGAADLATDVPPTRAIEGAPLVVLRRVGGARRNLVAEDATLTVEGYATEPELAYDICQLAVAHLHALRATTIAGVSIWRVDDIARPAFLVDPETEQPRYTATVSVTVRGTSGGTP